MLGFRMGVDNTSVLLVLDNTRVSCTGTSDNCIWSTVVCEDYDLSVKRVIASFYLYLSNVFISTHSIANVCKSTRYLCHSFYSFSYYSNNRHLFYINNSYVILKNKILC
jgi:hypothetical protein